MRRRTLLAGLVIALAVGGIAHAGREPVVGGAEVPPGKWPDAVAVLGPQGSCTGTLIAPDVVLTAGHCARTNPTHVIANTTDFRAGDGERAAVASLTAYPDWDLRYDVAVIVLGTPITGVAPRALGTACSFDGFGTSTSVRLVGFGLTAGAGGDGGRLNEAMAPVVDPDCSGGNGCVEAIAPGGEFVAGGTGTDSCFGDSGGPVYLDTPRGVVVIGAVSRGLDSNPMPCGGGGIYVRTDKVVQWLEATTGKPLAKDSCSAGAALTELDDEGGCAVGGGAGIAPLAAAAIVLARRRRRAR